ncbi:hypothetical protein ACTIVE_5960 [Actinomadura verrucosospora]|uniref:Uncharacterized protein n=1 Tax=Actinomadura verrucosospora TaxID=46165 RepID=A0A7D3ZI00_ACTVE|nr:hypothetical protein ACTIVE_5960 [Actinomadura verrucosospora]
MLLSWWSSVRAPDFRCADGFRRTETFEEGMPTYTVNVSGHERHDGEKPYTYALFAKDLPCAKFKAWLYHLWFVRSEEGVVCAEDVSRDQAAVVVIDCMEFPCHIEAPADCPDPCHLSFVQSTSCCCSFAWRWINRPGTPSVPGHARGKLLELGYYLPALPPEEWVW